MRLKSISIIIPNYNGTDLLKKNLPFVYEALNTSNVKDFEIIISDDNSTDDSIFFIKENYKDIILLESKENLGFSGNINKGIRAASKELVFLLNSDVELTPNYFEPLLNYFDHKDTFGVMGKIVSIDNKKLQDYAKYPKIKYCKIKSTRNYRFENESENESYYTFFLSGANALIDRKKLIELDCFNELFSPFYYEDVELSFKAWRLGYKCYFEKKSICKHPYSVTIQKTAKKKKIKFITRKNRIILHYLHLNGISLAFYFISLLIFSIFKLLVLDFMEINAIFIFLKNFKEIYNSKKNLSNLMKMKNSKFTLYDIKNFILNSLDNRNIEIFK
ncbi:MAG: glycosyltransferase family 2 protein [Candidatus Muirbacterium halophilum]|nr:glycosyltransferase family 2 protein [Candidatus Muirbacterium halophilum]MCK9474644.1 glycosyltransferase family 2 protein [Candidatus Muirbacterium halophilum]